MDIRDVINSHLDHFDLDIRKSKYARFTDQKCTPDIVSFLADCVINIVATKPVFTLKDIWESQYFIRNARVIFNKPWANDERAKHEYDKVLAQPLNLLVYAHILSVIPNGGRSKSFVVNNEFLLDYISRRDNNAYEFLYCYLFKVMTDSGFMRYIDEYRANYIRNVKVAREELYGRFHMLIDGNTPTHSVLDTTRIFHKIINIFACEYGMPGSKGEYDMMFSDLMYNRTNARDINKRKEITRQEALGIGVERSREEAERMNVISQYYIQKAVNQIKKIERSSEVHDSFGRGEATQVHHIFPKSDYPTLAGSLENLILLTPTQHFTKAHPNNNTQIIDANYQRVCLLSKADSIENSINTVGETYYRKASFIDVVNQGLDLSLSTTISYNQIKDAINEQYRIRL